VPSSDGTWRNIVLHSFGNPDGVYPYGGLTPVGARTLYGTTYNGGSSRNEGVVYRLRHLSNGQWVEDIVYRFTSRQNGGSPNVGVTLGSNDALFGSTFVGGANDTGVIYQVSP
jgi:hypothetical protein